MTADDRAAVAQILSLPDGPWEFVPCGNLHGVRRSV